MEFTLIRRIFEFESQEFSDPNPNMSIDRAKAFLANEKPAIINAIVLSDTTEGNKRIIKLGKNAGTHG